MQQSCTLATIDAGSIIFPGSNTSNAFSVVSIDDHRSSDLEPHSDNVGIERPTQNACLLILAVVYMILVETYGISIRLPMLTQPCTI